MKRFAFAVGVAALAAAACTEKKEEAPAPVAPAPEVKKVTFDKLSRGDFNLRAQAHFLPLFWRDDGNGNGTLDPDELTVVEGPQAAKLSDWVADGKFTKGFEDAYAALEKAPDTSKLDEKEKARRDAVLKELQQGKPTLVENDFSTASAQDKALVEHLVKAAAIVDRLNFKQLGTDTLQAKLPEGDSASLALYYRNHGPWCVAPKTENDPACTALPEKPERIVGLYPAEVQANKDFCQQLEKEKNGKALMDHFSAVVKDGAGFKAVPYNEFWKDDMEAVAKELDAAAATLTEGEEALKTYLGAAAQGFRTNDWEPANQAWVAMGATNSKWYLRIAPDETYSEPCNWKAMFATQLARINPDSLAWQQKLEPVKDDMEKQLAKLAGPPYKARKVGFKLPDFIDVVLNSGDQRNPHGATIGQSLPNWGPTAKKGGRTVVMTNLYTDADSKKVFEGQMAALFCDATNKLASSDQAPFVFSIVLHEAAHNLGPSHDYTVKGKVDDEVFGGPLAAMLEELKAQTSALYFSGWLKEKGVVDEELVTEAHLRDIAWAFGHISRGMYTADNKPRPYSQLASIQMGALLKDDALLWKPEEKAANGTDVGCFEVVPAKWDASVERLARRVFGIKSRGDKKEAEKLKAELVDANDEWKALREIITERWLRAPKATFLYSVRY